MIDDLDIYSNLDPEDRFYENRRMEQELEHRFPNLQVLFFKKGINPKSKKEQWQARLKNGDFITLYVPHATGKQPTSDKEVWLCKVGDSLYKTKDGTFEVVTVHLKAKLFDGETKLRRFQVNYSRFVDGKHPWNAYLPLDLETQSAADFLDVTCSPDKYGQQPTEESPFWFCTFKKVAYMSKRGDKLIAVVNLVREDLEAKEAFLEKQQRDEEIRKAEAERKQAAERAYWQEVEARAAARAAEEEKVSKFETEHPDIAKRLKNLERLERPEPIFNRQPFTGGGVIRQKRR